MGAVAQKRWQFFSGVLAPILLAIVGTLLTVGSFIVWSTSRNDDAALSRQTSLVTHILNDQQNLVASEQEDVAAWDDAVEAVQLNFDLDWIEHNLGLGMYDYFGHNRSYLLNPQLRPVYAMRDGVTVDPKVFETERDTLEPLAQRLREINWRGALAAYINGASNKVPNILDVVLIEGQPAIVSLMPIVTDSGDIEQGPGLEYIHITAQFLDAELAAEMTDLLLLEGARFSTTADVTGDETTHAIRNLVGQPIAYFAWKPDRPGARIYSETAPAIGGAVIMAAVIITILVLRLRRSTAQLEAGRASAQHLAYHDALTGLGNRVMFEERMRGAIERIKPNGEKTALLLLDLDRFKQVNDTLGHEAGDELIIQVAQRIRPLVRDADSLARLGGDEFAIVAENITSNSDIAALCNRIVQGIRKPFDLKAGQAFVGVSIGVSIADGNQADSAELTRKADIALYEAKGGGRNQYKIFEDRMNDVVQRRLSIEADLRAALLAEDQLSVTYAPIIRNEGSELLGVEAKINWHHPELGDIDSDVFLPIAETSGLIEIVCDIVLRDAFMVGAQSPGKLMAVRVFSAQLRNPNFFDKVFSLIGTTNMRPGDLELEIGEKMLSEAEEIASTNLRKFRQAGIRIALGDFGTGFTSLRLLQQFQVDRIKIDRSFIAELAQSPDPEAITHAVVWLARAIGVEVSADGVDTVEQKEFLTRMGCMSFQGELFSPSGQAAWLRVAARDEEAKPTQSPVELKDIEMWDNAS